MQGSDLVAKYLGKVYGHGASKCFEFVKDVYRDEFGIEIKNDYLEMLSHFHPVSEPKVGDIVLLRIHPIIVNHIGVYVGDNEFLHHANGTANVILTNIDDPRYKGRIAGYLRHPKFL